MLMPAPGIQIAYYMQLYDSVEFSAMIYLTGSIRYLSVHFGTNKRKNIFVQIIFIEL